MSQATCKLLGQGHPCNVGRGCHVSKQVRPQSSRSPIHDNKCLLACRLQHGDNLLSTLSGTGGCWHCFLETPLQCPLYPFVLTFQMSLSKWSECSFLNRNKGMREAFQRSKIRGVLVLHAKFPDLSAFCCRPAKEIPAHHIHLMMACSEFFKARTHKSSDLQKLFVDIQAESSCNLKWQPGAPGKL